MYKLMIGLTVICGSLLLNGCAKEAIHSADQLGQSKEASSSKDEISDTKLVDKGEFIEDVPLHEVIDPIEERVKQMSLDEKIGQLFIIDIQTDESGNPVTSVNDYIKEKIINYKVGGVVLFKANIQTKQQTKALIKDLQTLSGIPLFISVDEEGGIVSRIGQNPNLVEKPFMEAFEIGKTGDTTLAYSEGKRIGAVLSELGFNLNFAPVADIYNNESNKVIGRRSFGTKKEQVSPMVISYSEGLLSEDVQPVLKHFPGHGNTEEDSHLGLAYVNKTSKELEKEELVPFLEALQKEIDVMMMGHLIVKDIDDTYPATLSARWFDYMKTLFDTNKVLFITDAMNMGAISKNYEQGEAVVMSVLAGNDLILMPKDIEEASKALGDAYEQGILSDERLNESVRKILSKKVERKILVIE